MKRVLCRADAGPAVGLGHLRRCLSLAEGLARRDIEAVLLAPPLQDVRCRLERTGVRLVALDIGNDELGGYRDCALALATARRNDCDCVVVDSYNTGADYVATLRYGGMRVVVLDDLAQHAHAAHIVVNGGAGAQGLRYRSTTGDTTFLLGPQYALLGGAFRDLPPRAIAPEVRRILVSLGGGDDRRGALPRVLRVLDALPAAFAVTVVAGPFMECGDLILATYRHAVNVVCAPSDLSPLMLAADLAVSAGGQTLYELAATGTPAVAVQVFENQALNVRHLTAAGVVRNGGAVDDPDVDERIQAAVLDLIGSERDRQRMSCAGQRLVDGQGAARVADAIAALS